MVEKVSFKYRWNLWLTYEVTGITPPTTQSVSKL